jgi:DNA-binding MarR family transcriptional regulator
MKTDSGAEFAECQACVGFAVRKAARAVTQHYDRSLRETGLRATQFNMLTVLTQTGPMPLASLAEFMGLDRTSLTRNLKPAARKRWVTVSLSEEDRRVRIVAIAPAGVAAIRKALPAWRKAQASVRRILERTEITVSN